METYHFGVPKKAVWGSHVLLGLYLAYLGYLLLDSHRNHGIVLLVLGSTQALYHSHLWYVHSKDDYHHKKNVN
jgi:hypothetical protein